MDEITINITEVVEEVTVNITESVDEVTVQIVEGVNVPRGGTEGQVLTKVDGTDYNMEWADSSGSSGGVSASFAIGMAVALS